MPIEGAGWTWEQWEAQLDHRVGPYDCDVLPDGSPDDHDWDGVRTWTVGVIVDE